MSSFQGRHSLLLAASIAVMGTAGCDGAGTETARLPELPQIFELNGTASLMQGDETLDCHFNYIVELSGEVARTDTSIEYTGQMGGDAGRQLLSSDGSGWALVGDAFSQVRVLVSQPDQVLIEAVNLPDEPDDRPANFWDNLIRFEGTADASNNLSGTWRCAPFFTDLGGFVDDSLYADGDWASSAIGADPQ